MPDRLAEIRARLGGDPRALAVAMAFHGHARDDMTWLLAEVDRLSRGCETAFKDGWRAGVRDVGMDGRVVSTADAAWQAREGA